MYHFLNRQPRYIKQLIWFSIDVALIPLCLYFAYALRFETLVPIKVITDSWLLFPVMMLAGASTAVGLGLPKIKLAAYEVRAIMRTGLLAGILISVGVSFSMQMEFDAARSAPLIFGILYFLMSISSRMLAQTFLSWLYELNHNRNPVLIYGAGTAGVQLASALRQSQELRPVAFVDDNLALKGALVAGLPVHPPSKLENLVNTMKVQRILLAMPSASLARQRELTKGLRKLPCEIHFLPTYNELIDGKGIVESLQPILLDDLLGRDKVDLDLPEVIDAYKGKSILIAGSGGSIGSELATQILACKPSALILLDNSEFALYSISKQLAPLATSVGIRLISVLGSVCDAPLVTRVLKKQKVQVVLHAAAYKHVPLVECNELAGINNNVVGTKVLAETAYALDVERFILISTDKAVRPTNVMGASKRIAEMVVQDLASRSKSTLFSMVRFGNVLGSSGSVIPLFQEQLAQGGPLTLTHPDVNRYFMTIPEAARLVLVAGSFASDGTVFVLDMGKPILIKDLARKMIELSGLTVRDETNPDGDIKISVVGLRPGEKLYEELLIGENMLTTPHPKILRAQEDCLSELEIASVLRDLTEADTNGDVKKARALIAQWIEGYQPPEVQVLQ